MINEEFSDQPKPWFIFISVAAFAVVLFFSVYYQIQQSRYSRSITQMQAQKDALIAEHKGSDASDRAKAVSAKDYLKEVEKNQVIWSRLIEKIEATIPRRADTLQPVLMFRSYNGSSDGHLSVNATTLPDAPDPFSDIALTLKSFSGDATFSNVFVPSVAKSLTSDGQTILSFSMNFQYDAKNILVTPVRAAPTPAASDVPAASTTPINSAAADTAVASNSSTQ